MSIKNAIVWYDDTRRMEELRSADTVLKAIANNTFLGNNTGADSDPIALSIAQVKAMLGSQNSKSITIASPSSQENISFFYAKESVFILHIAECVIGTSPSITYNIAYSATRNNATPLKVFLTDRVVTAVAGTATGSFNNSIIPAGNFVWVIISALAGAVTEFHLTLSY